MWGNNAVMTTEDVNYAKAERMDRASVRDLIAEIADRAASLRSGTCVVADAISGAVPEPSGQEGRNPMDGIIAELQRVAATLRYAEGNIGRASTGLGL